MTIGYALKYKSGANSFKQLYGVFYLDSDYPDLVFKLPLIRGSLDHHSSKALANAISGYYLRGLEQNGKTFRPISLNKPDDFPSIGQLVVAEGDEHFSTTTTLFEGFSKKERDNIRKKVKETLEKKVRKEMGMIVQKV